VRDVAAKDVPGTIEAVAKMGYQGVEFAGYYGRKAEDLRKILDQNNLKCCGTHTGIDTLKGDALKGPSSSITSWATSFSSFPGCRRPTWARWPR